jgi:hypothetical protein
MRKFSCDEARTHLSDALAGEIGRPEANVLEAHLLECDPCRSLSELFLWQDRVIAELAAEARLDTLLARVRHGLEHLDQVSFTEECASRQPRPWGWMAAAAAFALALAGVLFWRPSPQDIRTTQVPTPMPQVSPTPVSEIPPSEQAIKSSEETPVQPQNETPIPLPQQVVEGPKPAPAPQLVQKHQEPGVSKTDETLVPQQPAPAVTKSVGTEVVQKPRTLDEGVRGGMGFLKAKAAIFAKESKSDELLLWTYLQGGLSESDPDFQALLRSALEKKLERTYNVALTAMVLEEYDRVKYQKRIAQCAQFLVDNQCANGQWSYGDPSIFAEDLIVPPGSAKVKGLRKFPVVRKREGPSSGDNSNTMYALLGLRAAHDAGVVLPVASVELAAKWWRDTQTRTSNVKSPAVAPEGWCYSRHDHKAYGSMTAGGVGSLVICDYILGRDWKKDREVACGMEWLAKNFSVSCNPGPYEHAGMEENSQHQYYYYMYALERAAILYGTEQIGGHFWFARGLQSLLDAQRPDGGWKSSAGGNELNDTCFAVLFLRKATRALVEVATPATPKK